MPSNTFGRYFKVTTFGESHGPAIGCVIDGCPPGLEISASDIEEALKKRAPGKNPWVSPRKEADVPEILSGLFEGRTTGAPIAIMIKNQDADTSKYEPISDLVRPGHADSTYRLKYGTFDWRGGGRASARETAARVAAGAVALKLLDNITIHAYLKAVGGIEAHEVDLSYIEKSAIFSSDPSQEPLMLAQIESAQKEGDSLGGIIEVRAQIPAGLGGPIYHKLESELGAAMLSIPASKGFEIGSGFKAASMKGSEHNDEPIDFRDSLKTKTNHAGGVLGGISTGMELIFRVVFKPTSSISQEQTSVDLSGNKATFKLPTGSRHDPALCIRAVPVVEAMTRLVLADAILANQLLAPKNKMQASL